MTLNLKQWNRCYLKQEGWLSSTERGSVSAISLRHILASPGYASGTIAVNVTWMKRGFSVCQTHRRMYPCIFNRLRATARYWSEIATFSYPLAFNAPVRDVPIGISGKVWSSENQRVTDRGRDWQTDRRTKVQPTSRTCAVWLTHVKNKQTRPKLMQFTSESLHSHCTGISLKVYKF